jgi:ABC-type multidrug transport system ATPase subunit/pSer/pThr/pTyr-binding forkhead associated (FHA) protein
MDNGDSIHGVASLRWVAGPNQGQKVELTKRMFTIGRSPTANDLVLNDDEISRLHAHLVRSPDGDWIVEDHSANGTFVDGTRVIREILCPGCVLAFGSNKDMSFLFTIATPAPSPTPEEAKLPQSSSTVILREGVATATASNCRLQLVVDRYTVRDIPLRQCVLYLGSRQSPDTFQVQAPGVASAHALVEVSPDGSVTIRDMQSPGGTLINGAEIVSKRLEEGDLIQLGACSTHLFLFREAGGRRRQALGDFDLNKPVIVIGRAADSDIRLQHPTVSSRHAEIRKLEGGGLEIVDLNSANGTFVNGVRVKRKVLERRDRISVGAVQLTFDGLQLEQEADGKRVHVFASGLTKDVRDGDGRTIRLLDNISIVLNPCEFIGLLGPSGAGKSTLMDAMNGFRPAPVGQLMMNDRSLYQYPKLLRSLIGYLPQDDILHTALTVRQCLEFSARLRMPSDFGDAEIRTQVERVLDALRLTERAEKRIRALSGGQRKRASLGIEMLSDPAVLYVDEPTAGQDPATEMQMMQLFRNLANRGSTVVINTHLLSLFSLFDKVAVLARGKLAYFGPAEDMLAYFDCKRPLEVYYLLAPPGSGGAEEDRIAEEWKQRYLASTVCAEYVSRPIEEAVLSGRTSFPPAVEATKESSKGTSWLIQMKTVLARQIALRIGDLPSMATLLLPPAVIGILACFMKAGPNEPMTLLIMILVAMWFSCSANVREVVDEWPIYRRERQRNLRLTSYLSAKLVYLAGMAGGQSFVFICILVIGKALQGHFLSVLMMMWIIGIQGGLIGLLISSLAPTSEKALYAFPLVMIPELLLAGLMIPVHAQSVAASDTKHPGIVVVMKTADHREMPAVLANVLSPLMVARWGLEGLADLYVHDPISDQVPDYRFPLLSSVFITLHPGDAASSMSRIASPPGQADCAYQFFRAKNLSRKDALLKYLCIQGVFIALMIGATAIAIRRREQQT